MSSPRPMPSLLCAIVALFLGQAAIAGQRIEPGAKISWGKAGVSLEDYWVDASQCGHQAAATDLTNSDPAKALVYASRIIDNASSPEDVIAAQQLVAPSVQWDRAATILQHAVEKCLTGRGYVKFRLTDGQFRHLRKLAVGSLERREYLHSLASDPKVVATQALHSS